MNVFALIRYGFYSNDSYARLIDVIEKLITKNASFNRDGRTTVDITKVCATVRLLNINGRSLQCQSYVNVSKFSTMGKSSGWRS